MAIALSIVCAFTEAHLSNIDLRPHVIYASVMAYNIIYGLTWGPIPWLLPAEIFPQRARSKGMALSTCSNWIFDFVIGMWRPTLLPGVAAAITS
ncbi:hypothetical protein PFICI_11928 [Pestalotiopsis fici W106-1]|uniref:Major facilitator superfamily (MFS) profile domain-containing protein n=1 Tax=Pestalotiopsis fici (strain W106-1 / CGMCC3.15140) TaxID=1229662 RepID=W3WUJ8_PESFW|nr:uncharacterized protein PFICI_11928 [Pestalotiopsis fici W106-1]ETS76541.1 hypothetical protein PFICI_11928 [Pestalotiopsis fici W106-1]